MENILEEFEKSLFSWQGEETTRPFSFRASGLPLCPVSWLLNRKIYNRELPNKENSSLLYFTGVGTSVHEILQKIGGRASLMYGDWVLPVTKRKIIDGKTYSNTEMKYKRGCIGPVKDKQGREYNYQELAVKCPKSGLSGHVDMLIPYKDGFIVGDFKTSSLAKINTLDESTVNYYSQIMTYWYLLSKVGPYSEETRKYRKPLKIYGALIYYINRDNPFNLENNKMFVYQTLDANPYKKSVKSYLLAEEVLKNTTTEGLEAIAKRRLCKDRQTALESGCTYCVLGCNDDKRILKSLKEQFE